MGGGDFNQIGPQTWEEAKCGDDDILICRLHNLFVEQTLYTCFAIGLFVYVILMYIFLQREHAHVTTNPEIQWHLKEIKKEEKEFEAEVKVRYLKEQRKRRVRRRAYMQEYKQEKLDGMNPKERDAKLGKEQKRREQKILHEQMLYHQVLQHQQRAMTQAEDKYLRQLIRKDVKEIAKIQKYQDSDYSETDDEQRLEDKVQYGSDSESDVPEESPYLDYEEDDDQLYGPEEDMEFDEEEKEESAIEMGDDELQFDQISDEDKSDYDTETPRNSDTMEQLVDTSDSNRSQDVITESVESSVQSSQLEEQKLQLPSQGGSLEMVDLKRKPDFVMKEFKPASQVNHSKKKRDKRKAKKEEEMRIEAEKEQRRLAKEVKRQKNLYFETNKHPDQILTASGKVLKKKVIPKQKIVDEKGSEWEVVDQKKTMIVEESASDDDYDSELSD